MKYLFSFFLSVLFLFSCQNTEKKDVSGSLTSSCRLFPKQEGKEPVPQLWDTLSAKIADTSFVNVSLFSKDIILDMRYASENNFTHTRLYACAECLLRYRVLKALLRAETVFLKRGFRIKVFDCYRPLSVQKALWKEVSVPGLVANPATGSRHNRGSAVDITLTDLNGNELDMGTDFDDFSRKGRTFCTTLPDTIKQNRMLLRSVMQSCGFRGINSEWWHFVYVGGRRYKLSDRSLCD